MSSSSKVKAAVRFMIMSVEGRCVKIVRVGTPFSSQNCGNSLSNSQVLDPMIQSSETLNQAAASLFVVARGGQPMTWQKGIKTLINGLSRVCARRLPGLGSIRFPSYD